LKRPGGVSLRGGLDWAKQICAALGEAHAQGVVHRDLKPENILITRDGTVKVMDFGIARSVESSATHTTGGAIIGTPAYMAPEQAQGKPADHRSDIYSLGLVMYEMMVGAPAFTAESSTALLHKHIYEPLPQPRVVSPYLPAFLERAILKCTEKSPKKRYADVAGVEHALVERAAPAHDVEVRPEDTPLPSRLLVWQKSDTLLLFASIAARSSF